ncbi:MAG: DnaJ family domain-containing protein, partial [Ilumatobacter sp.]
MDWISRIVEERLAQAGERGELDIPERLKGKPIPGIDESRPDGWWAESFVRRERSRSRRADADAALASARVGFWRA